MRDISGKFAILQLVCGLVSLGYHRSIPNTAKLLATMRDRWSIGENWGISHPENNSRWQ